MAQLNQNGSLSASAGQLLNARVVDAAGNQASIASLEQGNSAEEAQVWVKLTDGTLVLVPSSLLMPREDGVYSLPFTFNTSATGDSPTQMTLPVMEEELHVDKRTVDTGRGVRIHKTVSQREQTIDQPLMHDELLVEHVTVGRVIAEETPPQMRYEGDTLIVPVLEEVLVVKKQLMLKEEVHIRRQQRSVTDPQRVILRSEQVTVERFDDGVIGNDKDEGQRPQ
ncbi:YsnF/AvaK domain-containing protein [Noviherbaspirillum sp. Root189]|uniref:YsnF/AvaK domain-containing protein n=1 Tax=Noviherbaspirillum sp. Root189 TaxID=1736487 RepID=UPI000B2394D3|nr:YsnF/AvaK domain-containing protein [Noviherbaspirillum sp. Root189]